MLRHPF